MVYAITFTQPGTKGKQTLAVQAEGKNKATDYLKWLHNLYGVEMEVGTCYGAEPNYICPQGWYLAKARQQFINA